MPYKNRIKKVAAHFPGILEPRRLDLLNLQLIDLNNKGYSKLVENFLSNKNEYTIRPFLFEIYICRWLLSQNECKEILYEPDDLEKPPEFTFRIDDKQFQIEAKAVTQIINETVKKKLISQINRKISSKTQNVIELWLSEEIEPKDINRIVDWVCDECTSLNVEGKKEFIFNDEILAWISAVYESDKGRVGIEHFLGTPDGLAQKINTSSIKNKILSKIKKSNGKFKQRCDENIYNLLFLTCDFNIFLSKETMQEVLYETI